MARKKLTLVCEVCHREFHPYNTGQRRQRYCSKICYGQTRAKSLTDRVFSKIAVTDNEADCWLWTAYRDVAGYGTLTVDRVPQHATRLIWALMRGPIPEGLWVLHRCDNPPCCNLSHLFLGTPADNTHDAVRKGRMSRGEHRWISKLTEADVREIRASTDTCGVLGVRFGVTESTIGYVRRGHRWKHVK